MIDTIIDFFKTNTIVNSILDFYIVFIVVFFIVRFLSKSKTGLALVAPISLVAILTGISNLLNLSASVAVFEYARLIVVIVVVTLLLPDFKTFIQDGLNKKEDEGLVHTTHDSKNAIADAVLFLSSKKIGALITIEKHRLLDQYSEKAIQMNSDISKELIINIFSPLTPLHDGAVIIKGNKIRCAGAYYVLSQRDNLDKTVGSRHRAALGIAEVTDSVTIVVSEETGTVSIAYSGIYLKVNDKQQLLEYIDLAMDKEV